VRKARIRVFRIIGWIVLGIISFILLLTLVFYLGRDYFVNRALSYINEQQPGEVQMDQVYLIPFMNFPDITLHLQQVAYYEEASIGNASPMEPIVLMEDIAVTLDLIPLIKGGIRISEARLNDGFVHLEMYEDSTSNLERALGIRFGASPEKDSDQTESGMAIDLDKIELVNVRSRMDNYLTEEFMDAEIIQLESSFSYHPGEIRSSLEVDVYINTVKYQTINDQIDKLIQLEGSIVLDPERQRLEVEPSKLSVSGLDFETWGNLQFGTGSRADLAFTAENEGLELLNFLFLGVLDLEEIEQIGGGSIHLNGTVQGALGKGSLPVVRVNGEASDLGFRVKTVGRDVTGISFRLFGTNGAENDLSEGIVEVQDFNATFPEGNIFANLTASNIRSPELDMEVDCKVNLAGMGDMFKSDFLGSISGSVGIRGQISGSVNRESGSFLSDEGSISTILEDVSFVINRDSVRQDSISNISGEITLHDTIIESEKLTLDFNGNPFELAFNTENLLLYLLEYNKDPGAGIRISSEQFSTVSLLGDSSLSRNVGEEIRDFHLQAGLKIGKAELDNFIRYDSIPDLHLSLDSFRVSMPVLADVSKVNASLSMGPDSIILHEFNGTIGESTLALSGQVSNYHALTRGDSGEVVSLDFRMSSEKLRAEDLLTIHEESLLPEHLRAEHLEEFRISGNIEAPAAGLVHDSIPMDFRIDIDDLGWGFRYYPDKFKNFLIQIDKMGDHLIIENVQGSIGENNLFLSASIENFTDSLMENISGSIELYSDLMDFNQLLSYQLPEDGKGDAETDSTEVREPPKLSDIDFPNIDFTVNIGELRYGKHTIYGMDGKLRTSNQRVLYLDQFVTSPEGRGSLELNGQLNLTDPRHYVLSAELNLSGIDINDLKLELESGDSILAVKDHFYGIVDGRGLAEIFITPDLNVDMPSSVAQFVLYVNNGALINFTPLQAAGKFLDNKDLNNVRFDQVRSSFTLIDSRIFLPWMNVESTIGQLLITGEQGLDGSFLYLVRVPQKLARQAARSAMSEGSKDDGEDEVVQMQRGNFLGITLWSNGTESEFKLGDRRNKYKK
jgi:hypothetical protein